MSPKTIFASFAALFTGAAILVGLMSISTRADSNLQTKEPGVAVTAVSATSAREPWSWNQTPVEISPTGDLSWKPEPFVFNSGTTPRYIDFDNGNDANSGETKDLPWKHHPWDAAAADNAKSCKGSHTYIFKRGVVYRGVLVATESGESGNPVQLTSDPNWGRGEAILAGSTKVAGGWKKCTPADAPTTMPSPEKVWFIDLDKGFRPRCVFEVRGNEDVRIPITRNPHYKLTNPDDPMGDWYEWTGPARRGFTNEDSVHLIQDDPNYYDGAYVWSEWEDTTGNMGMPYISPMLKYNPARHSITRNRIFFGAATKGMRYYMENHPAFLDGPGEYYVADKGEHADRMYLRLPEDRDPNQSVIELGRMPHILQIQDQRHIAITGLRFSYMNVPLNVGVGYPAIYYRPTAIQMIGDCQDIRIANCRFIHVPCAVRGAPRPCQALMNYTPQLKGKTTADFMDGIYFTDNDLAHLDEGGILLEDGSATGGMLMPTPQLNELGRIQILRNRIVDVTFRSGGSYNGPAIGVTNGTLTEIAGNILDRCCGIGIWMFGGKGGNDGRDRPLIRNLVHHNKATNILLTANDWGAFAIWQGGPAFVFDNISGNPMGPKHNVANNREYSCNAYAFYLDGMFKSYMFNNIAWGKYNALDQYLKNRSAFMMVLGFQNNWFNNTVYKFTYGATGSSGQRNVFLGNIFADITNRFFGQNASGDISLAGGGVNADKPETASVISTLAYGSNVFFGKPASFATLGKTTGAALDSFKTALDPLSPRRADVGIMADENPLTAPEQQDFRLKPNSAAAGKGVRFFVPWSLYMTVGEWSFCRFNADPTVVMGENFFMSDEFVERSMYYDIPRNDLAVPGAKAEDYTTSPLEDWTVSALVFNGKDRYCILPDKDLKADYPTKKAVTEVNGKAVARSGTYPGGKRRTVDMGTNNFLIETHFKTAPDHTNGVLVSKMADNGYTLGIDATGAVQLRLQSAGKTITCPGGKVNDGQWHHVLAEVDRTAALTRVYVDGKLASPECKLDLTADTSLANGGDFLVGKDADCHFFTGAIDFLRVSRGTLADAKTTIDELYAWEFAGPFLRDFRGQEPAGKPRDAGALESGVK